MTTYTTDATAKFLIMCDIEKRAVELTNELVEKAEQKYAFCAGIIGYKMHRNSWRDAKDAGFERQADRIWTGFIHSYNGELAYAEDAFRQALKEKKEEIAATECSESFLDHIYLYVYLT